jgi:hypothetical protein
MTELLSGRARAALRTRLSIWCETVCTRSGLRCERPLPPERNHGHQGCAARSENQSGTVARGRELPGARRTERGACGLRCGEPCKRLDCTIAYDDVVERLEDCDIQQRVTNAYAYRDGGDPQLTALGASAGRLPRRAGVDLDRALELVRPVPDGRLDVYAVSLACQQRPQP